MTLQVLVQYISYISEYEVHLRASSMLKSRNEMTREFLAARRLTRHTIDCNANNITIHRERASVYKQSNSSL